ncbi:MAG: penicillin acylase family protein [bacterium]
MKSPVKIVIGIVVSLLLIITTVVIISFVLVKGTLPKYNGNISIHGISSDVKIYRDSFAVPYIMAESEFDAAFAVGYVHAQERMFQMDLARRAVEGRLSEIFGSKALPVDKMFRTLGLTKIVDKNFDKYNEVSRKYLEAYSKGVNAYLTETDKNCGIEFDLLGYEPEDWKPSHSIYVSKLVSWLLNMSWWADIAFSDLVQKLGKEKVKEILPDYPENAPTIIPKSLASAKAVTNDFMNADKYVREFLGFTGTHIGSNNWAVNGSMSASGKPMVANDMHLAFSLPGIWYFAVIRSDNWNAEGITLPGTPYVVAGKNQDISWVMTNLMADDSDFYTETLDSTETKYFFNGQWKNLEIVTDTIKVKDSTDVIITVMKTHRGPIISDVHAYNVLYPDANKDRAKISMRWTAFDFSDDIFSFTSINKAKNWSEFKKALSYFSTPGQNFVFADKEGNIGYIAAAKLPIRNSNSPTLIFDGTTNEGDWIGYVPFDEMPMIFKPPQNFIASANNKAVADFKYHISNLWEPPSRIERINELLKSKKIHSVQDFKNYQMDFVSPFAREIAPFILDAFAGVELKDNNLKLALELFRNWDYEMNSQSQVPAIYHVFYYHLVKNIFLDEMGEQLLNEYAFISNIQHRVVTSLLNKNDSRWFDDINTPQIEKRDDILRGSMSEALDELEDKLGKDIADWQWGRLHQITFKHPFYGHAGILDELISIGPYEIGGDGTTLFNSEYSFDKPYDCVLGPSIRFIYDFANPGELYFILPTGQSGHFASDHFNDMTNLWLNGGLLKIILDRSEIESSNYDLLILKHE